MVEVPVRAEMFFLRPLAGCVGLLDYVVVPLK